MKPTVSPDPSLYALRTFSLNFSSGASEKQSFTVNYLINHCGFSPESALLASKRVRFGTSAKPDSVLTLFRSFGLSHSQLHHIISHQPWLLVCDPARSILPKLDFFKSKGASSSDIVNILARGPRILQRSLENHIIPTYDFLKGFLKSDKSTIASISRSPSVIFGDVLAGNVKLLLKYGIPPSGIALLLRKSPRLLSFQEKKVKVAIDELKEFGFDPSKSSYVHAFCARSGMSNSVWKGKVELYKRWGWSDEAIHKAFAKQPFCMHISEQKIEAVFDFFVNHLGWDSALLARNPTLFTLSLEKRNIPRAFVLQFLLSRGLIKKVPIVSPFGLSEEKFLQKFVNVFKDVAPQLLALYEEKKKH